MSHRELNEVHPLRAVFIHRLVPDVQLALNRLHQRSILPPSFTKSA